MGRLSAISTISVAVSRSLSPSSSSFRSRPVVNISRLPSAAPPFLGLRSFSVTMTGGNARADQQVAADLDAVFKEKRILRSKVRKSLRSMDAQQRSLEDDAIQRIVLDAPWFRSSQRLCAYISCSALREVDTSKILSEILPARVMHTKEPIDLFLLPGLAFDRSGRRLGRGGGYYDTFLKNYQDLAKARDWKQPLLVALSYSVQIMEGGVIPVTPNDIPVDALVSPAGVIRLSAVASERMKL